MPEFPEIKGIDTKNFFLADHTFSLVFGVDGGGEGCRRVDFSFEECLNLAFLRAFNNGGQLFNQN